MPYSVPLTVEREGFLHQGIVDFEKFGAADGGAGGVEEELDLAESCNCAFRHFIHFDPFGDVDLDGKRLAAFPIDLRRCFAGSFLVDIGANDVGSLAGEDQRCRSPDAAPRTSDDDGLFGEKVRRLRHIS